MREILFRGKDCNGKWRIGLLVHIVNSWCISYWAGIAIVTDVIPDTISQYTGLTDNNGTKIFEGDILERKHKELLNHSQKAVVKFIPVKACFLAVDIDGENVEFISTYINDEYSLEVIGNIYDNPELLEVEE